MRRTIHAVLLLAAALLAAPSGPAMAGGPAPAPLAQQDDSEVDPPVAPADLKIVARARQILGSPAVWNKADNRKCPEAETAYSLYCALEKATLEVDGAFAHRGAAMQQARFVVDEITAKRDYKHRLMDYNNDPTTTFADIRRVFDLVEARIRAKLKSQPAATKRP